MHIQEFSQKILGRKLYPYQLEILEAITSAIAKGEGGTYTVMMSRQSGKNEMSAILEAYLLSTNKTGTIIKAAPTYKPQVINSKMRLTKMLESPILKPRVWSAQGYIIGLAPDFDPRSIVMQSGPCVMFYSAGEESNVVGGTASLLLELDEAQDIDQAKYSKDFAPMASTTNAVIVLYGTAWTDDTLLAQMKAVNLEHEQRTGQRRHFEYDWRVVAAQNPKYKAFVLGQIQELGEDHIAIKTQYNLEVIAGAGYLFSTAQKAFLAGDHPWLEQPPTTEHKSIRDNHGILRSVEPYNEIVGQYIAGIDVGGEERLAVNQTVASFAATPTGKRDATIITIGRVYYNELSLPAVDIVHQQWWEGVGYLDQYAAICTLAEMWNLRHITIDATGIGAMLASLLTTKLGAQRVTEYVFSRQSKSKAAFQMLALINSGRMKHYGKLNAPEDVYRESWFQISKARYQVPAPDTINIYVKPSEGHDDFISSMMLLGESLVKVMPSAYSFSLRPQDPYADLGRYA